MSSPTPDKGWCQTARTKKFEVNDRNRERPMSTSFKDTRNGKPTWQKNDRGYMRKDRFNNFRHPGHKKKGKGKQPQNKVEVLKEKEEYSHLVNSTKLTVFDWDCTLVIRNLPAQVDAVKKLVQREIKEIAIKKFCPIKKTFKNNAFVTLACVLNNKADVDKAVAKLSHLKVGDYQLIVSRFVKPHSFISNAFSACICNFPTDASEKQLAEILKDCGVIRSLDVEYSEIGAVTKVLVNLSDESNLATLLQKDGTQMKSASLKVLPFKPSTSVIVGNVHAKVTRNKLAELFGKDVLLVQKMSNMIFQVFFKDEESAGKALSKNGESLKNLNISVRPWSKKNLKQYKVFVSLCGSLCEGDGSFDLSKVFQECGTVCSITPVKKNSSFLVTFESKEGQKAALELSGNVVNGRTIEVTKKPSTKKSEQKFPDPDQTSSSSNANSKKKHVYFE